MQNTIKSVILLISIQILLSLSAYAVRLHIQIGNEEEFRLQSQTFLFGSYINQKKVVDSVYSNNSILFELGSKLPKGLYQVMIYTDMKDIEGKYQRMGFDVIITGEDLEFSVQVKDDHTLGMVTAMKGENYGYYTHFNENFVRRLRMQTIESAIEKYPQGDGFYTKLIAQRDNLITEQKQASRSITNATKYPMADFYFQTQKSVEFKSIDSIDFSNSWLKQSQFIPMLFWEYVRADDEGGISMSESIQKRFNRLNVAFDVLRIEPAVYELMVAEAVKFYEKQGEHETVVYINENFLLPDVCENQDLSKTILERTESLKKLLVGQPAPDLKFPEAPIQSLYQIPSQYTLLMFWESGCPHCQGLVEDLSQIYKPGFRSEFEIVAVSLDTSTVDYSKFIRDHEIKWFNYSDFKGWSGDNVATYNVVSTPTLFLLDSEKTIVLKPRTVDQLAVFFSSLKRP